MLVHTFNGTRKRHTVEFRKTRSPRDLLLSLPVRMEGDMPMLAPFMPCDPDALAGRARDAG
jgi:hypothetical protein